jgi:hypothetical protein
MNKPKIEIAKNVRNFLESDAAKDVSKNGVAPAGLDKQPDLPPWKRPSCSSKASSEDQEPENENSSSDDDLSTIFSRLFSHDDFYTLLLIGGAGGFGLGAISILFAISLPIAPFPAYELMLGGTAFLTWTYMIVGVCNQRHKRRVQRLAHAMAGEMSARESEAHSFDLMEVPLNSFARSVDAPERQGALLKSKFHSNSGSEWH